MLREKQLKKLADIVGEDNFSAEKYMRKLYSHDVGALPGIVNDILKAEVDAVVQPTSSEVVSNLIKYCLENKIPIVPRGHATSGYGGALPTHGGIAVEMTRMNEIYNLDLENMTVEVGAGIIWGALLEALEDHGVTIRAYPSSAPSSTVGGWVAAGGSGIGSTKYGGIKDQVVDLEVVLPTGQIIRTSNPPPDLIEKISKDDYEFFPNASTYVWAIDDFGLDDVDLTPYFVDSNGSLGIITKVVLRIIPLQEFRPFVASFENREQMFWAMQDIMKRTKPFYLHFITDGFNEMLTEVNMPTHSKHPWLILCVYEGSSESISQEERIFREIVSKNYGVIEPDEVGEHEWEERFYPMRIKRLGPSLAPSEVYVPLENMLSFLERAEKHFKGERFAVEGAVNNLGEVAVLAWFLDDERRTIPFLMGWYRSLDFIDIGIKENGRAYSIGMWNVSHSLNFYGKKRYANMARLKKSTDPKMIVNPNKVFSGPLQLSIRMSLLILAVAAVAVPIGLWIAGLYVGDLIAAYVPWLIMDNPLSVLIAFAIGIFLGVAVNELVNIVPITFVLTIGRPFLRLGRKIFH